MNAVKSVVLVCYLHVAALLGSESGEAVWLDRCHELRSLPRSVATPSSHSESTESEVATSPTGPFRKDAAVSVRMDLPFSYIGSGAVAGRLYRPPSSGIAVPRNMSLSKRKERRCFASRSRTPQTVHHSNSPFFHFFHLRRTRKGWTIKTCLPCSPR